MQQMTTPRDKQQSRTKSPRKSRPMIGCASGGNQTIDGVLKSRVNMTAWWGGGVTALPVVAVLSATMPAGAVEVLRNDDLVVRWDNTFKYSAAWRLDRADRALISDPNSDLGDRNFSQGLVSNRLDLLSELGIAHDDWGAEASAAAWYDNVYNQPIHVDRALPAAFYPGPAEFPTAVRNLHGRRVELLNGFVYGVFEVNGAPLTVRAGRHTVLWGESLFFAGNGIAAGQAPIDAIKAASVPAVRAQEVFMPVAQISAGYQPRANLYFAAYYQLEWRKTRLPGAGSFFSTGNFLDAGGYRLYVARDQYLTRQADATPGANGQFGLSARFSGGMVDWGLYAMRFHARDPQIYLMPRAVSAAVPLAVASQIERPEAYGYTPGIIGGASGPSNLRGYPFGVGLRLGSVGTYALVYPRGIETYGASFNTYLGDSSAAGEVSVRRNMPFVSSALIAASGMAASSILYPRGESLHAQVSMNRTLSPSTLWRTADVSVEVAANRRLHVGVNPQALDPARTRFAASLRVLFEPRYFAVLPGLDLSLPMSFGHGLVGRSSVDSSQSGDAGDVTVGVSAVYRALWRGTFAMTRFLGSRRVQPFADRDYISVSVQRTF